LKDYQFRTILHRFREYKKLIKFRVDIIVALTSVFGFFLGRKEIAHFDTVFLIFAGGFLVTATAHIINQLIEKNLDEKMLRTKDRPLVTGAIKKKEAVIALFVFSSTGLFFLFKASPIAAYISFVSLVMYAFLYTPMKQVSRLSIYIGAIPGALPILIGYVTATGRIDAPAIALFLLQVLWQLPHFWSIAWIWNDEYQGAGYDLMPVKGGRSTQNALYTFLSTFLLFPVIYFLHHIHFLHIEIFFILLLLTFLFSFIAYVFYKKPEIKSAKKLMLVSVIYLPVIQFILIINQINQ